MIFCIGLSKTGTTSVHRACEMLGLRSVHYPSARRMLDGDFSVLDGFDAAGDISVSFRFEDLDEAFPGSRFILTVRDEAAWMRSCAANFPEGLMKARYAGTPEREVFRSLYGVEYFVAPAFASARHRHSARVERHFAGDDRLLTLDVGHPDAWRRLACFLGFGPVPGCFPHANRTPAPADATQRHQTA